MADIAEQTAGQQQEQPWSTPTKQPFQNGVRTTGRAFNSPNWRTKTEDSPQQTSSQANNSPRSPFNRSWQQTVSPAITEGRRLYVGNMPYMAKKEDVEAVFAEGGYKIERVDISIDPFTGRNPSYCFVELETKEQADRAMQELDGKDLLGRPVKVKPGVAKASQDRSSPRPSNGFSPRSSNDKPGSSPVAFDRWQRNDASSHFKGYSENGRRLYVGGLPKLSNQQTIDTEIQTFFNGYNIEAVSKLISPHPSKRFEAGDHYYLFVDFASADEATAAQAALDGQDGPWGGKIRVGKARGESWKPDERRKWTPTQTNDAPESATAEPSSDDTKICVIMVGLPARGKSLIAGKALRYFAWVGITARIFNVGTYRREKSPHPEATFFDPHNSEGEKMRRAAAEAAVSDMLKWFKEENGVVGIFDATNSTKSRRAWIHKTCEEAGIETLFVESLCDDEDIIMNNILEVKTTSPDYKGQDPEVAAQDFRNRIRHYETVYETISEDEKAYTYVKLINVGSTVIINQIKDYLSSRLVYYIQNLHIKPRSIWLSRHGESEYNLSGKIGGDSDISSRGEAYARALPGLLKQSGVPPDTKLTIWTSTLKRTIQTARHLAAETGYEKLEWKALDELESGLCDGLTYEEIAEKYPEDFAARDEDKYNYRYRGGESYRDVVIRLEPIIMELERSENIIIVTHQAVLRCIYSYFHNMSQEQSPWMEVPLHTLIKLTPRAYGTEEKRFKANIPAVSTWRGKGTSAKHQDPGQPSH
ncbi:6-phosphofructo-2-kinase [Talaromyces islandicus]|uniref:fructose-2,6-bisphosphate 2-phosphatase n=1 Tax=Talaromyces islandicus TaxID=28573 RepID=A0A0U1M0E3_TALIS|nr:6-phosphofructo-2-kinase [Talaromyces islandicus]